MRRLPFVFIICLFVFVNCKGPQGDKGDKGDPGTYGTYRVNPGGDVQGSVDLASHNGGGEIVLSAGTYTLTKCIHIQASNIALRGEGTGATTLVLADGVQQSNIVVGPIAPMNPDQDPTVQPVRNVIIENMTIDGNNAGQPTENWAAPYQYINISGITIRFGQSVTVRNVIVKRGRSAGVLVEKSTDGFTLDRVEASESTFDGFSCNKSYHGLVVHSRFRQNMAAGITATCDCSDTVFSNNETSSNGSDGFFLAEAHRNVISDNVISGNADTGIYMKGPDCGVTVTGASNNAFLRNYIGSHTGHCAVYLTPITDADGRPGPGNIGIDTLYYANGVNGICTDAPGLYQDINPVVAP